VQAVDSPALVGASGYHRARHDSRARHSSQIPTGVARGLTVALRGVPFARARLQKRAAERGPRLEGASVAPSGRSREPAM